MGFYVSLKADRHKLVTREVIQLKGNNPPGYSLAIMPYAPIKNGFEIGGYEIWPFYDEYEKRISNHQVIDQLHSYLSRYVEYVYKPKTGGRDIPIESIAVITPTGCEVGSRLLTENEISDVFAIGHILFFSATFEYQLGYRSSNPFATVIQQFQIGREGVGLWGCFYTQYNLLKFLKPPYLSDPFLKYEKTGFCDALGKLLQLRFHNEMVMKVLRSLEQFFYTSSYGDWITDEHRILNLVMSFETLFNFEGKMGFAKAIDKEIYPYNPMLERRRVRRNNREIDVVYPQTVWWAYDLYDLRSQIIHGQDPDWKFKKYGNAWTRIEYAGLLLKKLYKTTLTELGIWKTNFIEQIDEAYDMDERLLEIMERFNSHWS